MICTCVMVYECMDKYFNSCYIVQNKIPILKLVAHCRKYTPLNKNASYFIYLIIQNKTLSHIFPLIFLNRVPHVLLPVTLRPSSAILPLTFRLPNPRKPLLSKSLPEETCLWPPWAPIKIGGVAGFKSP